MKSKFMILAIDEAKKAFVKNEVPVGCIIEKNNVVIASSHNTKEYDSCITSHAEIKAIVEASKYVKDWRLNDCILYTTLFPCPMCASAIQQSRISTIYYILPCNNKYIFNLSKKILKNSCSNHKVEIKQMKIDYIMFNSFFNKIRNKNVSRETYKLFPGK